MAKPETKSKGGQIDLTGQFLIAMPAMADTRFERSVVFICTYSKSGAMGLIINRRLDDISFNEILRQVTSETLDNDTTKSPQQVWFGGPVEQGRGLVIHTPDYQLPTTMKIGSAVMLTASTEILKDIARAKGPKQSLLALGYAGWGAGQLESEIAQNSWLTCEASTEIVFDLDAAAKYDRALHHMGVDPVLLSADAGHA